MSYESFIRIPWWTIPFLIIGIGAIAGFLSAMFSALGRRPFRIIAADVPAVDTGDFLRAIAGVVNAPVQSGGHAILLNNGKEFFPEIISAINSAERSINFMVYIWQPGKASDMVFDALIAALKRGVQVRILLDGFGGSDVDKKQLLRFTKAGGKYTWFRLPVFGKLLRFYKRNHRRAIVIDGKVGFLGGAAISDIWLGTAEDTLHWRDCMVKVTGTMAEDLQSAFAQVWADTRGEILTGSAFYPVLVAENGAEHISVISSPSSEYHPINNIFWLSFKAARQRIWIAHSYFVPDRAVRTALKERARAGIDVRILVPSDKFEGRLVHWASHRYYEQLLKSGVKIFAYQPTMMHCKTIVIDSKFSIVGSANLDIRSTELNKENILCISEERFARDLENTFQADLQHAKEIKLKEWQRRNLYARLREKVASLFEEQY